MEIAIIVLLAISVILSVVSLIITKRGGGKNAPDATLLYSVKEEAQKTRDTVELSSRASGDALFKGVQATNSQVLDTVKAMSDNSAEKIAAMREELQKSLAEMSGNIQASMKEVREENTAKLNEIRGVVDEKLGKTLNERLQQSFELVTKQLESVNKGLGEMQSLSTGMNDLKKVLGGVKSRGSWGEVSLESLLAEILAPTQYRRQFPIGQENNEKRQVDFAVVLPGLNDNQEVILPVDSKFPIEDFAKMEDAAERGDNAEYLVCRKALRERVKKFAGDISSKYINVPKTTDFAIMYLPIESLYAEILRMDGLQEELQDRWRVVPAGPTNFAALLNSLRMGFKTVQIQKYSNEMVGLLKAFTKDFNTFVDNIATAQKQVDTVQKTLSTASKRTEIIQKKLTRVELLGIVEDEVAAEQSDD